MSEIKKLKAPFIWDYFSDQPYPLKDKAYKRKMRKKSLLDILPLFLSNLIFFPLSITTMKLFKAKKKLEYGIGVNLDKGSAQVGLVEELGVKHLIIRIPLWDIERLDEYVVFVKSFGDDKHILLNILQDREHIENKDLLEESIGKIFRAFEGSVFEYQIGSAINRTKWGFFSVGEYLKFYQIIQKIRDKNFPALSLVGSSVIDFEYHYTIRSLFNFETIKFDTLSSLLYVDRRGSPYNTQMGIFDTNNKIDMLYALARLSPKTADDIYITEVNWPLSNTAPYAPTSELECISEAEYAKYLKEYLSIAKKSQKISRVYWHQLVARGYGLVDDSNNEMRRMDGFWVFKELVANK